MSDIQVEEVHGIEYYSLETPGGHRWSWDEEDLNADYARDALYAWSRLLDFIEARNV